MTAEMAELAMFFDEDFEPSAYVDALFSSVLSPDAPPPLVYSAHSYTDKSLAHLQTKCSALVSHLDFYTNELSTQLSDKLDDLRDTSSVVSTLAAAYDPDAGDGEITRLQYYLKSVTNAVQSLHQEVERAAATTAQEQSSASDPIDKLIQLGDVKQRLQEVLHVFERVAAICQQSAMLAPGAAAADQVTIARFSQSMDTLRQTIQQGLSQGDTQRMSTEIDELGSILPLFHSTPFHAVYKAFVTAILAEKQKHQTA
ncbi:Uncharacterized protein ABC855_g1741 [[Candida] zeylanoides]